MAAAASQSRYLDETVSNKKAYFLCPRHRFFQIFHNRSGAGALRITHLPPIKNKMPLSTKLSLFYQTIDPNVEVSCRDKAADLKLDISKRQLASLLGTIPETLSRIFNRMSNQGLIRIKGRRIRILNTKALKKLATPGKIS